MHAGHRTGGMWNHHTSRAPTFNVPWVSQQSLPRDLIHDLCYHSRQSLQLHNHNCSSSRRCVCHLGCKSHPAYPSNKPTLHLRYAFDRGHRRSTRLFRGCFRCCWFVESPPPSTGACRCTGHREQETPLVRCFQKRPTI